MANEPVLTVVGNLAADPELRFTPAGKAVANFTVAATPRVKNGDQWEDGETLWFACSVWGVPAENVAESLQKGVQVIVSGRLKNRAWEDRDGNRRTSLEMDVDHVGPALQWQTVKVSRAGGRGGGESRTQRTRGPVPNDPWAAPQGQPAGDPWAGSTVSPDEPPF